MKGLRAIYIDGRKLELEKRIGRGGEGEVFLLSGQKALAVKIYNEDKRLDRAGKVSAMIQNDLSKRSTLVSFPQSIVTSKSGEFLGFTMKLIEGFKPIHELYGPKSRKLFFPKANYRFLVRCAANVSRAVREVHETSCIIGDLNHSGILVSNEAIVALIDADSFQFAANTQTFPCLVGVPEFTPPELQGKLLNKVVRNKNHDLFGLAVLIFQLLFMGRHPYAGRQASGKDLTIDQLIAQNQFAYSRIRSVGSSPPDAIATLDDFNPDICEAFEKAFGLFPENRPTATEWVNLLSSLESQLLRCANDNMHFYASQAKTCPWCKMERLSGALLFIPTNLQFKTYTSSNENFKPDEILGKLKQLNLPSDTNLKPKIPSFICNPSQKARTAKKGKVSDKIIGLMLAAVAIVGWIGLPQLFICWIPMLFSAWSRVTRNRINSDEWTEAYLETEKEWEVHYDIWIKTTRLTQITELKKLIEEEITTYKGLSAAKANALQRLQQDRRSRQLSDFLDRYLIVNAKIANIGQAKKVTLASFGIESAADILRHKVLAVPGFGPATTEKLLVWRASIEKKFVYNPAPLPEDTQALLKLEAEYSAKSSSSIAFIKQKYTELMHNLTLFTNKVTEVDKYLVEISNKKTQLVADFKYLNLQLPSVISKKVAPTINTPSNHYFVNQSIQSSTVYCPRCNSTMVRRTARKGYRRGSTFWGCSRFPKCKGTRN